MNLRVALRKGVTLTEALVAMLILSVVVLGTFSFQYHSTHEASRAQVTIDSIRTALVLLETWKGTGGTIDFDPVEHITAVPFLETAVGPASPDGMQHVGSYMTRLDTGRCYATLSYADATVDEPAMLHVFVDGIPPGEQWNQQTVGSHVTLTAYMGILGPW